MASLNSLSERLAALVSSNEHNVCLLQLSKELEELQQNVCEMAKIVIKNENDNNCDNQKPSARVKSEQTKKCTVSHSDISKSNRQNATLLKPEIQTFGRLQDNAKTGSKPKSQTIIRNHIENVLCECFENKTSLDATCKNKKNKKELKKNPNWNRLRESMINVEDLLEDKNQYFQHVINELNGEIDLAKKANLITFNSLARHLSKIMNYENKLKYQERLYKICTDMCGKEMRHLQISKDIGNAIEAGLLHYNSIQSLTEEQWESLKNDVNNFELICNNMTKEFLSKIDESVSLEKLLDEFIQRRAARHNNIKEEIKSYDQLNENVTLGLESGKIKLSELNSMLLVTIKNKSSLDNKIAEQYQKAKSISTALSALDQQIEQFKNDTVIIEVETTQCQNDDVCCDNSTTINIQTNGEQEKAVEWADRILKKIDEKRLHVDEWLQTPPPRLPVVYNDQIEGEIDRMSLEIEEKQKLADLESKKVQEIDSLMAVYAHFQDETSVVSNKIDDCLDVLTTIFHNLMIDNYGKTLETVRDDSKELCSVCSTYENELDNVHDESRKMEALLEERIQLLQERMKSISAQRQQIEEANRGLEEEINKLGKKFVEMAEKVKAPEEPEESKPE